MRSGIHRYYVMVGIAVASVCFRDYMVCDCLDAGSDVIKTLVQKGGSDKHVAPAGDVC